MKIYVASSWRADKYPVVLSLLRSDGHDVYDFRENGFSWDDVIAGHHILLNPDTLPAATHQELLEDPQVCKTFQEDLAALKEADVVVMVTPCGSSAHLEAGYAVGIGKELVIYQTGSQRPDVMYKLGTIVTNPCALRAMLVDMQLERDLAEKVEKEVRAQIS
ncbi:hypothetical protein LCGC14_1438210 [marine sediment metagenome]|uniref:2'-deoxynucleoside 5'-phosphate N-hydrolase 1 n=1 Tax=marine sediment metagenome TaxID=412755 RepID=A0A0F9JM18_9ZZZZ